MTKRINFLLALPLIILLAVFALVVSHARAGEHFSVKEFNEFHELLHQLQHEALPQKDYQTIRARAGELVSRGEAIVKLGVPEGVSDATEFRAELQRFNEALARYKKDAADAPDAQLEQSYLAVHDSFEMLAAMLPKK